MAIGFAHCEIVHASAGSSAVGVSAYNSREKRQDVTTGESFNFTHKAADLIDKGVLLPKGAPERLQNGEALWGAAMAAETTVDRKTGETRFKKGAQVAKHIVLALPKECTDAERRDLTLRFAESEFVKHGVAVEWAIHAPGPEDVNWHAHLLVSTRRLEPEGFGKKCQEINPSFARGKNGKRFVSEDDRLTERWAETQNSFFKERGLSIEVDPFGSLLSKQEHLGPTWHMADSRKADRQAEALAQAEQKARQDPAAVLQAVTQRKATFTLRDIERTLQKAGLAGDELEQARTAVLMHPELVPLGERAGDGSLVEIGRYTTQAVREQEQRAMLDAQAVASLHRSVGRSAVAEAAAARTLDAEQGAALDHACRPQGLCLIEGRAGAGKSYTMGAIRDAHERLGYRVIGLAPTNTVAQDLRDPAGAGMREASTVHLALLRQEKGRGRAWTGGTVLMVDEAAMLDAKVLGRLLRQAAQCRTKVILVGDDRQLASVERGGLFAELRKQHGSIELREIRRQAEDWQRQASMDFSEGRVGAGLDAYDRRGFVCWSDSTAAAKAALVADWSRAQAERPDALRFIYAATNREVDDLNRLCRASRVERGELAAGVSFHTVRGKLELAAGDRLQFYGNDRGAGIFNGTVGTVEQAQPNRITVRLDSGQAVSFDPSAFDKWGHGYAGTVYRGQGKTQLEVSAFYDSPVGWNARTAYVGMTRHKAVVNLYVGRDLAEDRATLARQMARAEDVGASIRYEAVPQSAPKPARSSVGARLAAAARAARSAGPDPLAQVRLARPAADRRDDQAEEAQSRPASGPDLLSAAMEESARLRADRLVRTWTAVEARMQQLAGRPADARARSEYAAVADQQWTLARDTAEDRTLMQGLAQHAPDVAKAVGVLAARSREQVRAQAQSIGRTVSRDRGPEMGG